MEKAMLYPADWGHPVQLNTVLRENKERNEKLIYGKQHVLSVSGEQGVVNQVDLLGRSYAGESVAPYHIVETGDVVYTKSPLKLNPYGIIKQNHGAPGIVSTLYAVYHCSNPETGQYLENYFSIDSYLNNYLKPLVKRGAKNDMKVNNEEVLLGKIPIPSIDEQKKINSLLAKYDNIIELKINIVKELLRLKKSYLAKMFPREGSGDPEIRFTGFTGSWEQHAFSDIFTVLQNCTLSRAELDDESGCAKNLHYGDILTILGEYTDASKAQLPFIKSYETVEKFSMSLLQDGDIIMADTAEDESAGKCTEIANIQGFPTISGLHTIPMRPKGKYAPGYMGYYMNSLGYHEQLLPIMQGVKVTSVSKSALQKTRIMIPPRIEEQKRIGSFFIHLDELIGLRQSEVEEEQKKKKALMQLLLTGLIRVNV